MENNLKDSNIDKPKFKAKLVAQTEMRRQQLAAIARGPVVLNEQLEILEDYLYISRKRRNSPLPLFQLQFNMLMDLIHVEKGISKYKKDIKERKATINDRLQDKEHLEKEIKLIERELLQYKAKARAIRDIADGIAWRLFDYNRAALYEIANRPGKKHINLDGLEAELGEFAATFDLRKGVAILNDLTNFMKLGDLTVRETDGSFEIVEVKKGTTKSNRITLQKQKMLQAVTFLNVGERQEETGKFIIHTVNVIPETYSKNASKIIMEAEKEGIGIGKIGDHLVVECTDFLRAQELGIDPEKLNTVRSEAHKWVDEWASKKDIIQPCSPADTATFIRNYAPLSIFPFSESVRVKLMTNALLLITYVNFSSILRYFEKMGWRIMKHPSEYLETALKGDLSKLSAFVTLRKADMTVEITGAWFGRMAYEFLKPKSLLNLLETQLSTARREDVQGFPNFSGEAAIWD